MSQDCDRAGVFRGVITECGLFEAESGAKAINITASLSELWDAENKQWCPWSEYEMTAKGAIWIVKKDGSVNMKAVESAVMCAGWGSSLEQAAIGVFGEVAKPCQFVVQEEKPNDYHDETQFRISFLNDFDRTPGGTGNVTPERAKALQAQYGSQFRALAGNANRNAAPPTTKPAAPKPTAAKSKRPPDPDITKANQSFDEAMAEANAESGEDGIPF